MQVKSGHIPSKRSWVFLQITDLQDPSVSSPDETNRLRLEISDFETFEHLPIDAFRVIFSVGFIVGHCSLTMMPHHGGETFFLKHKNYPVPET